LRVLYINFDIKLGYLSLSTKLTDETWVLVCKW